GVELRFVHFVIQTDAEHNGRQGRSVRRRGYRRELPGRDQAPAERRPTAQIQRVLVHLLVDGRHPKRGRDRRLDDDGARAGARVLVRSGDLHRVAAAGGVDVAHGGARGPSDSLGGTVAPLDGEGEAGGLVHGRRVGGRDGEGGGLAAHAVGGAG